MTSFTALDVETANARYGSICAFGITVVADGVVIESIHRIVKPPESLAYFEGRNIGIHGISASTVQNKPSLKQSWAELVSFLDGKSIVCHNAGFDINALSQAAEALGVKPPQLSYICTMQISRKLLGMPSCTLPLVAAKLGVPLRRHHEASSDSEAAAGIALALMNMTRTSSPEALASAAGLTPRWL